MIETPGATLQKCPEPAETSTVDAYIGARIRGRRVMLKLSEDALARRLLMPVAVIHAFEEGMVRIRASTLHDIGGILKVPMRFFFDGYMASADNDV
ncbi:helix-turn-helix domain-containing protein [Asticcacaulis sp. AC460]|uniref:helix-turn-helix domain-containing protein n=1 Tax=Asticcacaulis sp. AC460 TaxID=1282360 RepID=UPI00138B043E|nr:helix-turn-helix transcriptional regulator [Asticcacaulis sp. AC460]